MAKTGEDKRKRPRRRTDRPAGGAAGRTADADVLEPEVVDVEVADDLDDFDEGLDVVDDVDDAANDPAIPLIDVDADNVELRAAAGGGKSVAKYDPMAAYMQEIRSIPVLSREQEHELAVRWAEQGDVDAARQLVEANLRLVVKIAYEYRRAYRNILDLVQEGNIGLLQAVRKYDPHRGVKLSSYAAWWIRAYILKFILNNWRLVKIGTTQAQRKLFYNLRKESEKLERLGFRPTPKLLAARLDVPEDAVVEMQRRLAAPDASLDAPVGGDDDGARTRLDLMRDDEYRPDVAIADREFRDLLREKLTAFAAGLEGREKTLFEKRWLTDEPMTLQEIGDMYGISRERARQIEKRMLDRLRGYLEREFGGEVDISQLAPD